MARKKSPTNKFHLEFLSTAQKFAWAGFQQHDVLFLTGPAGVGKALTLDSRIYTPDGYKLMKNISVGDIVLSTDGKSQVIGIYPQGKKPIYRIHFDDGAFVDCCDEHQWLVSDICNGWKDRIVTTKFIRENYINKHGRRKIYIPVTNPVNHTKKNFIIHPYLMGILISEGSLTNSNVCFSSGDKDVKERVENLISEDYWVKTQSNASHRIVKRKRSSAPNVYKEELKKLGLWKKRSEDKFIPEQYLFGSLEQRICLLNGLMDGDGTVGKNNGSISLSTASYDLVKHPGAVVLIPQDQDSNIIFVKQYRRAVNKILLELPAALNRNSKATPRKISPSSMKIMGM